MNEVIQLYGYTVLGSRRLRTLQPNICCYYNHQLACLLDFSSQFSSYSLRSMLSWNLTAFTYIRKLALLLLQAGDIENNPGPRPIDPNPVICYVCNKKINRGINLEASATCYQEDCEAQCHQLCNGLPPSQTSQPLAKRVLYVGRPSKLAMQARYAYHCSVPSCTQVCCLIRTCSVYIEPRREVRDRILATPELKCQQHNDMGMKEGLPLGQQHPRQDGNLQTQQRHPIEQQHLREPST